ncbi:hypothetical protein [Butyrivibrio sp. LB2008]|uniref:hypothetical protein n=1 Tax=Butyrivibrio sp. LB2008 TaxID=1408305 RepID=UPI00047CDABA|nr:hypothetical protein [Butyrivibrio sp. LB2008]
MSTLDYVQFAAAGFLEPIYILMFLINLWGTDIRLKWPAQQAKEIYIRYLMWPGRILILAGTIGWFADTKLAGQFLLLMDLSEKLSQMPIIFRFVELIYFLIIIVIVISSNSAFSKAYNKTTILFHEKKYVQTKKICIISILIILSILGLGICGVSFKILHMVWKISIIVFFADYTIMLLLEQCGVSFDAENHWLYVRRFWKAVDIDLEKAYIICKPTEDNNIWSIKWSGDEYDFTVKSKELIKRISDFDKYINTTEVEEKPKRNNDVFDIVLRYKKNILFMGYAGIFFGMFFIPLSYMLYKNLGEIIFIYVFSPAVIILNILGIYFLLYYYRYSLNATEKGICCRGIFREKSFLWDEISAEVNHLNVVFKKDGKKEFEIETQCSNVDKLLKVLKEQDLCPVTWNSKHADKLEADTEG